jgi:hypothetical protein
LRQDAFLLPPAFTLDISLLSSSEETDEMSAELTRQLFARVAGLALAIGAVACGGAADEDPTQAVDNGGQADSGGQAVDNGDQAASASPPERVDGFQIFPHNVNLFPPITLPPPPDGGAAFPPFTFPALPDGGLFAFPTITLPGLPPITLPGLPPITLPPPPDGGITLPPLPGFPGH